MIPIFAKTLYGSQEWLLKRHSLRIVRELDESQYWPRQQLKELQLQRLRGLLTDAYTHTPYWRSLMEDLTIDVFSIGDLSALQQLPFLTKQDLRKSCMSMVWQQGGKRVQLARSSGSTNEPIEFYTSSERESHVSAARMRGHASCGMRKGEREMYFWGSPVEITKQDRIKQFRDWLINDGFTNGMNISEELLVGYYKTWMRFRPKCIFSYPSSLDTSVTLAAKTGIDLSALRERGLEMIITTAEPLEPVRERIERAFGVPVYDSYGLREVGLIGHECQHRRMHVVEEQLILETIDPDTLEPTDGEGELVATNLVGHVMPMIRYRTGDIVTISDEPCPCGRKLRHVSVTGGRACDFVVTTSGVWLSGYAFAPYLPKNIPGIVKLQVQQERLGHVKLLLVTDSRFGPAQMDEVRHTVRQRMQCDDEVEISIVDEIPTGASGKHRIVISKVATEMRAQNATLSNSSDSG